MRQIHRAGEKLFIDYAGPTIALTDASRAHIFGGSPGRIKLHLCLCPAPRDHGRLAGCYRPGIAVHWWRAPAHRARQPQSIDCQCGSLRAQGQCDGARLCPALWNVGIASAPVPPARQRQGRVRRTGGGTLDIDATCATSGLPRSMTSMRPLRRCWSNSMPRRFSP